MSTNQPERDGLSNPQAAKPEEDYEQYRLYPKLTREEFHRLAKSAMEEFHAAEAITQSQKSKQ